MIWCLSTFQTFPYTTHTFLNIRPCVRNSGQSFLLWGIWHADRRTRWQKAAVFWGVLLQDRWKLGTWCARRTQVDCSIPSRSSPSCHLQKCSHCQVTANMVCLDCLKFIGLIFEPIFLKKRHLPSSLSSLSLQESSSAMEQSVPAQPSAQEHRYTPSSRRHCPWRVQPFGQPAVYIDELFKWYFSWPLSQQVQWNDDFDYIVFIHGIRVGFNFQKSDSEESKVRKYFQYVQHETNNVQYWNRVSQLTQSTVSAIPSLCADTRAILALSVVVTACVTGSLVTHGASPAVITSTHTLGTNTMRPAVQWTYHYKVEMQLKRRFTSKETWSFKLVCFHYLVSNHLRCKVGHKHISPRLGRTRRVGNMRVNNVEPSHHVHCKRLLSIPRGTRIFRAHKIRGRRRLGQGSPLNINNKSLFLLIFFITT